MSFPLFFQTPNLVAYLCILLIAEHKSTSPIINVPSSRSTRSRTVPEYDPDSDEAETFDSPPLAPTPATMTTSTTAQNQTRTSPSQHLVSPSPSASRQTFASPPGLAHQLTPHSVLPPLHRSTSQSSQWRKAMCKAFVEGDIALRGLHSQEFDFASLATKLTASCPTSPESSCIFFPSASWTYTDIITFPDSTQAIEALSNYFQRLEASLRLFPTNQSRQFLYEGCQQWWATGSCSGGLDWQALYLATTASSAVVSSDDQFSQLAQGWMYLAGRMVLSDQREPLSSLIEGHYIDPIRYVPQVSLPIPISPRFEPYFSSFTPVSSAVFARSIRPRF